MIPSTDSELTHSAQKRTPWLHDVCNLLNWKMHFALVKLQVGRRDDPIYWQWVNAHFCFLKKQAIFWMLFFCGVFLVYCCREAKRSNKKSEANFAPVWVRQVRNCASDFFLDLFWFCVFSAPGRVTSAGVPIRDSAPALPNKTGHFGSRY